MSDAKKTISYAPTDGLSYDPSEPKYWDEAGLRKEITRVFEICNGCRMCFKYCDSFPLLFDRLDNAYDGDVRKLTDADVDAVMNACFQCKLCDVQCPYTPRDHHEYLLDFPKLVHRYDAVHFRKGDKETPKQKLQNMFLGNPDLAGKMARASFGMANKANRSKAHRWFMEKVLGVHQDKLLPDFAATTFEKWAGERGLFREPGSVEVVLFQTCFVQHNEPEIGRDVVEVLEKNQIAIACVKGLLCCGMPSWEHGDLENLRKNARHNLDLLLPYVERGAKVLVVNPTCSMMMRREYPELVAPEDRERAKKLSGAIMDTAEYLWSIRNEERFCTDFKTTPKGRISYHAPCHLRAQAVGFKGRDLLRKIPGVSVQMVMECCGHDGTHAMRVEGFEYSQRVGKRAFDGMTTGDASLWSTECPLAAIQFEQHAGTKALHPLTILARAYRENGFPEKVPPPETPNS